MNTADRNRIVETLSRASNQLTFGTVVTQQRVSRLQKLLGYYVGMVRTRNICNTQKPYNFTTITLKGCTYKCLPFSLAGLPGSGGMGTYSDSKNYLVTMFNVQCSMFCNSPSTEQTENNNKKQYTQSINMSSLCEMLVLSCLEGDR